MLFLIPSTPLKIDMEYGNARLTLQITKKLRAPGTVFPATYLDF